MHSLWTVIAIRDHCFNLFISLYVYKHIRSRSETLRIISKMHDNNTIPFSKKRANNGLYIITGKDSIGNLPV